MLLCAGSLWPGCYGCVKCIAVLHRMDRLTDEWSSGMCGWPDKRGLMVIVSSYC